MGMSFFFIIQFFVMLMFSGSGFGNVPVGMVPAPEEPFMYQVAPEKCLYFVTWASMVEADPQSDNLTEKFIAEKEVQHFLAKAELAYRASSAKQQSSKRFPHAADVAAAMPDLTRCGLTRATSMYLDGFELRNEAPHLSGGLVVSLGPYRDAILEHLLNLQKAMLDEDPATIEIDGKSFFQIAIPEGENVLTWGIHDEHLLATLGADSMEKLLANAKTPEPAWLTQMKTEYKVERIATLSHIDLEAGIDLIRELSAIEPEFGFVLAMFDRLGLLEFKTYQCVTGFEGGQTIDRGTLDLKARRGLMKAIANGPLKKENLQKLPRNPLALWAIQIDLKKIYSMIEDEPEMIGLDQRTFGTIIEQTESVIGGSFKDDLIGSFGDAVYLYTSENDGGIYSGWTLAIDIQDAMSAEEIMQRLVGFAQAAIMMGDRNEVQMFTQNIGGYDVYYVQFGERGLPFAPSWSLVNDQLLFSLFPQAIKGHIARQRGMDGFDDNEYLTPLLAAADGKPVAMISQLDMQHLMQQFYPFVTLLYASIGSEIRESDQGLAELGFSSIDVPSVQAIAKHLRPATSVVVVDELSFKTTATRVLPGGNLGSNLPGAGVLLLPAVMAARQAAQRTTSMNNMKQIGLGMHNYHDTTKGFPPAYTTDKDGKPLLSWRVHILPFMEQQALYDQFHFDEPWDSEHNKTLIEKMPFVYRLPGSDEAGTKTVYLGVGGDGGIFSSERLGKRGQDKWATGTTMAHITDGTSNTIMVVEVNEENAVIWTKPEDFEAPEMSPLERLLGNWSGGFLALFADGSVQFIGESVNRDVLSNYFNMKDGNPIFDR
jgi:hypothetical protein